MIGNQKRKESKLNFRNFEDGRVGISLDETTTLEDIKKILGIFNASLDQSHER